VEVEVLKVKRRYNKVRGVESEREGGEDVEYV
jgi:hypothetical protein